jgi:hypothetical protein
MVNGTERKHIEGVRKFQWVVVCMFTLNKISRPISRSCTLPKLKLFLNIRRSILNYVNLNAATGNYCLRTVL